jgi:hypothetical protein
MSKRDEFIDYVLKLRIDQVNSKNFYNFLIKMADQKFALSLNQIAMRINRVDWQTDEESDWGLDGQLMYYLLSQVEQYIRYTGCCRSVGIVFYTDDQDTSQYFKFWERGKYE